VVEEMIEKKEVAGEMIEKKGKVGIETEKKEGVDTKIMRINLLVVSAAEEKISIPVLGNGSTKMNPVQNTSLIKT